MQRRAVATYVALFVLVGAATGALIATAESPEVTFEDPDFQGGEGDTFEHEGVTYTITDVTEEREEADDGSVTIDRFGTIEWEEVVEHAEDWEHDAVVTYEDAEWRVVIEGDDPSEFTLREELDREAILRDDPNADNETVEHDGEVYVVVRDEDGEATFVPADEYFPEPRERQFAEGETFEYQGHEASVAEVTAEQATIVWEGPETMSRDLVQEGTVTLGGTQFVTYFPDGNTVMLSSDLEAYEAQIEEIDEFEKRVSGLYRVLGTALLTIVLLVSLAFLPSRY